MVKSPKIVLHDSRELYPALEMIVAGYIGHRLGVHRRRHRAHAIAHHDAQRWDQPASLHKEIGEDRYARARDVVDEQNDSCREADALVGVEGLVHGPCIPSCVSILRSRSASAIRLSVPFPTRMPWHLGLPEVRP